MAAIQPQSNGLSDITDLINLFKNQNTNTSNNANTSGNVAGTTTSTTQNNASPEAIGSLLQQILGGSQGLSAIASGQKSAGLYNSSTNSQLSNDLITRAAGEVAKLNTSTTTSTANNQATNQTTANNGTVSKQAPLNLGTTVAGLLAGQVLAPVGKAVTKKLGEYGTDLSDSLLGSNTSSVGSFAGNGGGLGGAGGSLGQGGDYGLNAALNAGTDSTVGSSLGSSLGAGLGSGAGIDVASTLGSDYVGSETAGSILGSEAGASAIEGAAGSAGVDTALTAGAEEFAGSETAGAILGTAAEAEGGLDLTAIAAAIAWIICTELVRQSKMPQRYYIYGARIFADYPEIVKQGYYAWAIPSVKHLRLYPESKYSKLLTAAFNKRAENIAAHAYVKGASKSLAGAAVTVILYPICAVIGACLKFCKVRINPMTVYCRVKD